MFYEDSAHLLTPSHLWEIKHQPQTGARPAGRSISPRLKGFLSPIFHLSDLKDEGEKTEN